MINWFNSTRNGLRGFLWTRPLFLVVLSAAVNGCWFSASWANSVTARPNLVHAKATYQQHCAVCHGISREGKPGVPALQGGAPAWGSTAESMAQTIRHGIRVPGHAKTRGGIMPAFKTNAAEFTDDEVRDLVEYILQLRKAEADSAAALRGQQSFAWCVACHGQDARGVTTVGGVSLLNIRLQYGASRDELFQSIAHGRAGVCPPWEGFLDEAAIRQLADYLAASRR
jgi:cytochrome c oxidase cbb3-type subunit 3